MYPRLAVGIQNLGRTLFLTNHWKKWPIFNRIQFHTVFRTKKRQTNKKKRFHKRLYTFKFVFWFVWWNGRGDDDTGEPSLGLALTRLDVDVGGDIELCLCCFLPLLLLEPAVRLAFSLAWCWSSCWWNW